MKHLCVFLLFSCLRLSVQKSRPEDDHYVAAVVEYKQTELNAEQTLVNYTNLIKEAAAQGADIVVFPELTLTNFLTTFKVPVYGALRQQPVPALRPDLFDEYLVGISAAAQKNNIYVVINGRERLNCTSYDVNSTVGEYCPSSREYYFITNVVFNRAGAVIDRYRKMNLYVYDHANPALRPSLGEFTTDFGVTFGHFIGFDILFQVPAVQMLQQRHVKNVIFPTMWKSELPFLTAVQVQEAYAYANDVNFLAAGASLPWFGSAGSGIYSGKAGALISILPGSDTTKLLVAKVPKVPGLLTETYPGPTHGNPAELDHLRVEQEWSLRNYASRLRQPNTTRLRQPHTTRLRLPHTPRLLQPHTTSLLQPGSQEFTLAHGDTACNFKVKLAQRDGSKQYRYRAAVFSGLRSSFVLLKHMGVRMCGIYACTGDVLETCGIRFVPYQENTTAIFEELTITATMPSPLLDSELSTNNSIVYPVSATVNLMPLEPKDFTYSATTNDNVTEHTMTLKNNTAELYSFALWGRNFAVDVIDKPIPVEDLRVEEID